MNNEQMTLARKARYALGHAHSPQFRLLVLMLSARTGLTHDQCRNEIERIADGKGGAA